MSAFWRQGREFPNFSPVWRADDTTWKIERAIEKLWCAMQRPVFRSQPEVHESGEKDRETAPVRAPVSVQYAPTVIKEKRGPLFRVELQDLPDSKGRMC